MSFTIKTLNVAIIELYLCYFMSYIYKSRVTIKALTEKAMIHSLKITFMQISVEYRG